MCVPKEDNEEHDELPGSQKKLGWFMAYENSKDRNWRLNCSKTESHAPRVIRYRHLLDYKCQPYIYIYIYILRDIKSLKKTKKIVSYLIYRYRCTIVCYGSLQIKRL